MKKLCSLLLITCVLLSLVACGETKPQDNVAFESLEEMQDCLNGKWFSIESFPIYLTQRYSEIIFNGNEIMLCETYGWDYDNGDYIPKQDKNFEFLKYCSNSTQNFKYKNGQIIFEDERLNINIKEYVNAGDGKEIKEYYLQIGNSVYFKVTNNTEYSDANFITFQKFCKVALSNKDYSFADMYYREKNTELDIECGIEEDKIFKYMDYDNEKISFGIEKGDMHYFGQINDFKTLYKEIEDLFCHKINIIALIGTEMPDFEKKDWAKYHKFYELRYYLYMNSEGKLVSNIS